MARPRPGERAVGAGVATGTAQRPAALRGHGARPLEDAVQLAGSPSITRRSTLSERGARVAPAKCLRGTEVAGGRPRPPRGKRRRRACLPVPRVSRCQRRSRASNTWAPPCVRPGAGHTYPPPASPSAGRHRPAEPDDQRCPPRSPSATAAARSAPAAPARSSSGRRPTASGASPDDGGPARIELLEPSALTSRRRGRCARIAHALHVRGVPSPTCKPVWGWPRSGTCCATRPPSTPSTTTAARRSRATVPAAQDPLLRAPARGADLDQVPAIVDRDTFECAQRVSQDNSKWNPRGAARGLAASRPSRVPPLRRRRQFDAPRLPAGAGPQTLAALATVHSTRSAATAAL
jgi:hypothetical protein